ncbi:MAG: FHA domain-containing protein [Anaerolineales bacterium]|nr:FHA domain-containing protein [Anaerolineales bacterium]
MSTAAAFLLIRLALFGLLFAFLTVILVELRRGLRRQISPVPEVPQASLVADEPFEGQPAFTLTGLNTIGRARDNTIILEHPSVSSYHARLSFGSGNWLLEDLGSRNGTTVNGLELEDPLAITYGDRVQFGAVRVHLQAGVQGVEGVP